MESELAGEIALEQRERQEQEGSFTELAPEPEPALPAVAPDQTRPRGRPWAKGQSGNPAGRPPGIHPPAAVAEYIIGRKTIPLAKKVRELALAGDRSMLRLWYQNVAPARRGTADWAGLSLVQDRAELRGLRDAVADAAEKGAIRPEQAEALVRLVNTVMSML
jgi:hypothetical protein